MARTGKSKTQGAMTHDDWRCARRMLRDRPFAERSPQPNPPDEGDELYDFVAALEGRGLGVFWVKMLAGWAPELRRLDDDLLRTHGLRVGPTEVVALVSSRCRRIEMVIDRLRHQLGGFTGWMHVAEVMITDTARWPIGRPLTVMRGLFDSAEGRAS